MNLELEPCPCCGATATLYVSECGVCVMCTKCYLQTISRHDSSLSINGKQNAVQSVIEKWNKRVDRED